MAIHRFKREAEWNNMFYGSRTAYRRWYDLQYRLAHPKERKANNERWYGTNGAEVRDKVRYVKTGWNPEQYHRALIDQAGLCDVCKRPMKKACADHNHVTHRTRALLCDLCNMRLAVLENPRVRAPLEAYIADHQEG